MEYVSKYSNFFVWWWTCTCIYGVLHWCANPLLLKWSSDHVNSINCTFKQRNLPFIAWYPLNTDDIYNYVYLYLMQIIGGISSALGIICYDSFYVIMLMIICAQFQYINTILMKINFDKYDLNYQLFVNKPLWSLGNKIFGKLQRARGSVHSREQIKKLHGLSHRDYKVTFLFHLLCSEISDFFQPSLWHIVYHYSEITCSINRIQVDRA